MDKVKRDQKVSTSTVTEWERLVHGQLAVQRSDWLYSDAKAKALSVSAGGRHSLREAAAGCYLSSPHVLSRGFEVYPLAMGIGGLILI
jgi:hypothetical protein